MRIRLLPAHVKYDLQSRFRARFLPIHPDDAHLKSAKGIIHIGAHWGQERYLYRRLGLDVLWVEGNPKVFEKLKKNIGGFSKQRAVNALLSDQSGDTVTFQVSSNHGMSSSILGFSGHKTFFPGIDMVDGLQLKTDVFSDVIAREQIDLSKYDALAIDVQGAELMVLRGMSDVLTGFRWLQLETSDIETYEGGQTYDQLLAFLKPYGFQETGRRVFRDLPGVGQCFDILMERKA